MGCGSSKVSAVPDGCAMGTEPKYRGIKQTQGREVTILWDTDTTGCPPDNYTSLLFLNALHKVFVQNLGRKEPRVVLVYDNDRPLNTSPEAVALRSYLQTESVELIGSQGTTQQTLEDEIRKIVATANPQSTIVLISSPTAYQDACACARQRSIFVERLFSTDAVSRFIDESNANWMCSLKQFLNSNNITDWRLENRDPGTTAKKESIAEVLAPESCRVPTQSVAEAPKETTRDIAIMPVADEVDAGISEKVDAIEEEATTEQEVAPVIEVSPVTEIHVTETSEEDATAATPEDVPPVPLHDAHSAPPDEGPATSHADEQQFASACEPDVKDAASPEEGSPPEEVNVPEKATAQETGPQSEATPPPAEATGLDDKAPSDGSPDQEDSPLEPPIETEAPPPPPDSAVEHLCADPAPEPAADPEQAADPLDGEETCDSSIGHAVDTMLDDVQTGLMHEFGSSDGSSLGGSVGEQNTAKDMASPETEDAPGSRKVSAKGSGGVAFAEPHTNTGENAADAAVSALEGTDSDDAPTCHSSTQGRGSVKSRLGLSMRRGYTRAPSAVTERDLDMEIEPMDAHAAAEDGAEVLEASAAQLQAPRDDAPEVVPMIGPDPTMAWKADIMRTLRAAGEKAVKVETLLGMVPHPECAAGGEYRTQLEEHVIGRGLAVWAEDGYAVQLA